MRIRRRVVAVAVLVGLSSALSAGPEGAARTPPAIAADRWCTAFAVSPDGARVVTGEDDGVLRLYDASDGAQVGSLSAPDGAVTFVGFAGKDGAVLVSVGRSVRVWSTAKGKVTRTIEFQADTAKGKDGREFRPDRRAVAVSPRDPLLAIADADRKIRFWNLAVDREAGSVSFDGAALDAAFSPDGARLAVLMSPKGGTRLQVFDVASRALVWKDDFAEDPADPATPRWGWERIAFSPDGKSLLAVCSERSGEDKVRGSVRSYDLVKKGRRWTRHFDGCGVARAVFAPSGGTIAAATGKSLVLLDPATGATVGALGTPVDAELDLEFSPDGARLFGRAEQVQGIVRWDVADAPTAPPPSNEAIRVGATPVAVRGENIYALAVSPDGKTLVTLESDETSSDSSILRAYDLAKGTFKREFGASKSMWGALAFVGNDPDLVLACGVTGLPDGLWAPSSGQRRGVIDDRPARGSANAAPGAYGVGVVAASACRRELAVAYVPGLKDWSKLPRKIGIVDPATNRGLAEIRLDVPGVDGAVPERLAFSRDGRSLAAAFGEPTPGLATWSREGLDAAWKYDGWTPGPRHVDRTMKMYWHDIAFAPDGRSVVGRGEPAAYDRTQRRYDPMFCAWDPSSKSVLWTREFKESNVGVAVSPRGDGVVIATFDGALLVDPWTGETKRTFARSTDFPRAVAFSPDGRRLFAALGKTVVSWDLDAPK